MDFDGVLEHLGPYHLQPITHGPRCARLDFPDIKYYILGLWTFVAIFTFLILCWRRIFYVGRLCGTVLTITLSLPGLSLGIPPP